MLMREEVITILMVITVLVVTILVVMRGDDEDAEDMRVMVMMTGDVGKDVNGAGNNFGGHDDVNAMTVMETVIAGMVVMMLAWMRLVMMKVLPPLQ